jgi:GTP-binding nuclear protein Ran
MSVKLPNFKCIIVGDFGTGKTSLLRHISNDITMELHRYVKTSHPVIFETNVGAITFDIRDTKGQEMHWLLKDSYFKGADCAVIVFDVTNLRSYENVFNWYRRTRLHSKKKPIPMVLCGNKIDIGVRKVFMDRIINEWSHRIKYFEISVRDKPSLFPPFLYLAQKLTAKLKLDKAISAICPASSETTIELESLHHSLDQKELGELV